ncbi:hypothetical protein [Streptomyces caniferus]|uniref:hypothetical protein n=1 Tax=Streptomyces caniferus TaxID=285557 RepID=UPI00382BCBFC
MRELIPVQVTRCRPASGLAGREAARKPAWPVLEIPPRKNQQSSAELVRWTLDH